MLSISGMLGPSSSRPSESEDRPFSRTSSSSVMSRPQDHTGLQSLLNAATSSEPISPEGSYSPMRSSNGEMATPTPQDQLLQSKKRKAYGIADEQTPSPYRGRFAASLSPAPKKKRAPRPQYTKEQEDFIWFCRDDLAMSWRKVVQLYNNHWHPFEVEPHIRSESGLQSRYYRILDFPVKIRKKKEPSRPDLGLIPSTNRRYPWMGVIKAGIEGERNAERGAQHITAAQQKRQDHNTDHHVQEREEEEEVSGSEVGGFNSGSDMDHNATNTRKEQHRDISLYNAASTDVRVNRGARVILHASETDGGAERGCEWEYSRQYSSSYDRCDLKSVNSCEDSLDTIKTPSQLSKSAAEEPIHLPPLRRHFPAMNNVTYDRGISDELRKRTYEMSTSNHVCKISVINLCI